MTHLNILNVYINLLKINFSNLPLSIFISLPCVTIIFLLVNVAYFVALEPDRIKISDAVAVTFISEVFPNFMSFSKIIVSICIAVSCVGGLNGTMFSYSRLFFAGARYNFYFYLNF